MDELSMMLYMVPVCGRFVGLRLFCRAKTSEIPPHRGCDVLLVQILRRKFIQFYEGTPSGVGGISVSLKHLSLLCSLVYFFPFKPCDT